MRKYSVITAESVSEGHPDKLCDLIADSVLDACLRHDPMARVACEVMATAGKIMVAGEITAAVLPDFEAIVRDTVKKIGHDSVFEVEVRVHAQSPDIAGGVNDALEHRGDAENRDIGAGDQGVMYGYATNETAQMLPMPSMLAHRIMLALTAARRAGTIEGLLPDAKAQVSVEYIDDKPVRTTAVVVSTQHTEAADVEQLRRDILEKILPDALAPLPMTEDTQVLINPSGRFVLGGFDADTGLTGRKLMVDTYGGMIPHGGGALSGKDSTKVDRSASYMTRYVAKNLVAAGLAQRCAVGIAYAIGVAQPVSVSVDSYGTGKYSDDVLTALVREVFDFRPAAIIDTLHLREPIFAHTSNYGHFTKDDLPWEQADRVEALQQAAARR